ncbi:MAG TPA: carbon-nitrogen hydrolase family protein [Pyrinomonadaceae bacterium]|nr:carbon-nitrogen hydrolase family protein [Pyrinomonadaceae bacterium]
MKCRVSAVQFGIGTDVGENLNTCLWMIDEAARHSPDFIVLPEFSNHCAIYESLEYAQNVALDLKGEFLKTIADKALEHNTYIKINVTLKKPNDKPTVSNLLYSPKGKLVGRADKQILMSYENNFCSRAEKAGDIVKTEFGNVGMYCGSEGLLMETTRLLTVRGAILLLNSPNSFASDDTNLHLPVRAAENKVFIVSSCKVENLVSDEKVVEFAEKMNIKSEWLQGTGESQIIAPDGVILAKANRTGKDIVVAEIELDEAKSEIVLRNRRPELYKQISTKPKEREYKAGAKSLKVAVCQNYNALRNLDANLVIFPELCFFTNGIVADVERAIQYSAQMIKLLSTFVSGTNKYVVTSIIEKSEDRFAHVGVLIDKKGIIFRQKQLHKSNKHHWINDYDNELKTIDLPFGKLSIIIGEDSLYPETFRLAAYQNAEIVAVPFSVQERWETEFGLLERSAENRCSIIAATRPNKSLEKYGNSLILTIGEDSTLWTEWKNRHFDGNINYPIVNRAKVTDEVFYGEVCPANSGNRLVSQGIDVVDGRAYRLLKPLSK